MYKALRASGVKGCGMLCTGWGMTPTSVQIDCSYDRNAGRATKEWDVGLLTIRGCQGGQGASYTANCEGCGRVGAMGDVWETAHGRPKHRIGSAARGSGNCEASGCMLRGNQAHEKRAAEACARGFKRFAQKSKLEQTGVWVRRATTRSRARG